MHGLRRGRSTPASFTPLLYSIILLGYANSAYPFFGVSFWVRVLSGDDDLRATIYGSFNYSCEEGKYVKGISYELDYTEETDVNSDSPAYYIYSVSFKCSSSTLGEFIKSVYTLKCAGFPRLTHHRLNGR